jgi:predicted butyrate kinase (DUF1464 family)
VTRVAGTDPGTSSLDLIVLDDGVVREQMRFSPEEIRANPAAPVRWLEERGPFDLVAGPSGYGLPLVRAADCTGRDRDLMSLVHPDERGRSGGVAGFSAVVEAFCRSPLPTVFLPGVIHLPTVPPHRKFNRIDMGTPDKLAVAALALLTTGVSDFVVVELGTAFTAALAVVEGRIVDGRGGTLGPLGWSSGGAWDGEVAYLLRSLGKSDLFHGGVGDIAEREWAMEALRESLADLVAGLMRRGCGTVILSGRLLEKEPALVEALKEELRDLAPIVVLPGMPRAWVKRAAQGAAVIADGLTGGRWAPLVERMQLRQASGTALDWLRHPRAAAVRAMFLG